MNTPTSPPVRRPMPTPPGNNRSTSAYSTPTPANNLNNNSPNVSRPLPTPNQRPQTGPVQNPPPSRGGAGPTTRTLPTPPNGSPSSGGQSAALNGSPQQQSTATSPPSTRPATNGTHLAKSPPTPSPRGNNNIPPPTTNGNRPRRPSFSLHTDRQNVSAVVDLPINDDAVQQREIPTATPTQRNTSNRPATASQHARPAHLQRTASCVVDQNNLNNNNDNATGGSFIDPRRLTSPTSPTPGRPARAPSGAPPRTWPKPPQPPTEALPHLPPTDALPHLPPTESLPQPPGSGNNNNYDDSNKQERLRAEALKEIVNTERDYVQHLELVTEVFLQPLKEKQNILPTSDLSLLFSNWELLVGVNQEILNKLDEDPDMVGLTFLGVMQYLKMYKIYCANQPTALKVLEAQQEANPAFAAFLQECLLDPKCKGQNLFSYLIKPIQRLCKYPLLIKVLLQNTDPSHPDYPNLAKALGEVEEIVTYVNEGKRQAEKSQKILEIALATEGGESLGLVTPTRNLEMEQELQVIIKKGKPSTRKCMLFNDAVLLVKDSKKGAKPFSKPKLMGFEEIKVINLSDTEELAHMIELQYSSTKEKYVLIFVTEEIKQRWLKEIKRIVKNYQLKKLEELKKEEEERSKPPSMPLPSVPKPLMGSSSSVDLRPQQQQPSSLSAHLRRTTSLPGRQPAPATLSKPQPPTTPPPTTKPKPPAAEAGQGGALGRLGLLKRRSSFNNKTLVSVTKPVPPTNGGSPLQFGIKGK